MYAVIQTGGKQYRVRPGDVVRVEKLDAEEGGTVSFDKVLLRGEGEQIEIGTPFVDDARVTARVRRHGRGDKIEIVKFKRRKDYQRHHGHRQDFTDIEITDLGRTADEGGSEKASGKGSSASAGKTSASGGGQKTGSKSGGKQRPSSSKSTASKSQGSAAAKSGGGSASGSTSKQAGKQSGESTSGSTGKGRSKSTGAPSGRSGGGKGGSKSGQTS